MQANPNEQFDREYDNLTDKQRAVIDAHAQNPDETNREKARIAGEEILGNDGPINESYCSDILRNKYPDLADYREEIEQNVRPTGQEQTKGNPLDALKPDNNDSGFQSIQDRPVKGTTDDTPERQQQPVQRQSPIQVYDTGTSIAVEFSYRYVEELLRDQQAQLPKDLHEQLVDVIFRRFTKTN